MKHPGLRQFLTTENPLKMMKNYFYLFLKALFVLKIFKFCPDSFGHVRKRLDKKAQVGFKIYDVINWETYNYYPISQEVKATKQHLIS